MTVKYYIQVILLYFLPKLQRCNLALCQDSDSAHTAKKTSQWAKDHRLELITLPGVSPDLSIFESMANPLKRVFYKQRCKTKAAALQRFIDIFDEGLN